MLKIFSKILSNVLTAFYQPFWAAVLLSVLFMFCYKQESSLRSALEKWLNWFRTDKEFRRLFLLVFYVSLVLFRTLINRNMWLNPVSKVWGIWGFYEEKDGKLVFTTEAIENLILLLPFTFLYFRVRIDRYRNADGFVSFRKLLWQGAKISFTFSFSIEMLQLLLRLGT